MRNIPDRAQQTRSGVAGFALAGAVLAVALQLYFVARWDRYVESIPASRLAQRAGIPPRPQIAATKLSARDGAGVLLVSGFAVALITRRYWTGVGAFAIGAAVTNVIVGLMSRQIQGNLWPLSTVAVLILTLAPILIGGAIGLGLRRLKRSGPLGAAALFVLLAPGVLRCASTPSPTSAPGLSLIRLAPAPGTTLHSTSVIDAAFHYRLSNMRLSATYVLVPTFSDRRGAGYTFNAIAGPGDAVTLNTPGGVAEVRYPIVREWTNERLARPIELWFQIVEMGESSSKVVAKIGPYRYPAEE